MQGAWNREQLNEYLTVLFQQNGRRLNSCVFVSISFLGYLIWVSVTLLTVFGISLNLWKSVSCAKKEGWGRTHSSCLYLFMDHSFSVQTNCMYFSDFVCCISYFLDSVTYISWDLWKSVWWAKKRAGVGRNPGGSCLHLWDAVVARRYSPLPYIKLPAGQEVLPCKKRLRVRLIRCYICAGAGEITGVNFSENGERFENANEMF